MTLLPFSIRPELPEDADSIDHLHAISFGPGRYARAAFRVREGVPHDISTSFTATLDGEMIGSVRLTPVMIDQTQAMLLGPLAVMPWVKGRGAGRALMMECMHAASGLGVNFILLVGDLPYYGPFGFQAAPLGSIVFPAPVDPARILVANLREAPQGFPDGAVIARR